jgi:hypothetical protein
VFPASSPVLAVSIWVVVGGFKVSIPVLVGGLKNNEIHTTHQIMLAVLRAVFG